jgi:hypothetical protein
MIAPGPATDSGTGVPRDPLFAPAVIGLGFCCLRHDRTTPIASGISWVSGDHPAAGSHDVRSRTTPGGQLANPDPASVPDRRGGPEEA